MNLPGFEIEKLLATLLPVNAGSGVKGKGSDKFSGTLKQLLEGAKIQNQGAGEGLDFQALSGIKGKKFLARLKTLFLENGLNPDSFEINDTGLAAFGRLLAAAGFDPKQIESLLQEMKADKKDIRLSALFKGAAELETENDSDSLMDESAVPYIESVLTRLLPNPADRKMVWEATRVEGEGIDLSRLIQNLKKIAQNLPDKGRRLPGEVAQRQVGRLMNEMGFPAETGTVTLEKFIARLEAAVSKPEKTGDFGKGVATADLNRLMENMKPVVNPKNRAGHPDENEKRPVAVSRKGKITTPAEGKNTAAVDPAKTEIKGHAPKTVLQNMQAPVDDTESVVTAASDPLKEMDSAPRSAAAAVKPPVRTLPAYVVNQVSRQLVRSYQNGVKEIRLQLHPPNLGRLQMHIDNTGEAMRVQILTEQQSTHDLLLSHTGDLKSVLSDQGFRLEKIDVQFDQFFDQSLSYARQESGRSNGRQSRGKEGGQPEPDTEVSDEKKIKGLPETTAVLDLVA